jgi:hypothetical protein
MSPRGPEEDQLTGDEENLEGRLMVVPGFQAGGRVERTGIALVHEGEYIMPAPGSEAAITVGVEGTRTEQVINYYFPVEIQVIGAPTREYMQEVAAYIYDELRTAFGTI